MLEHPDIACALRTGYPRRNWRFNHWCAVCGCGIAEGEGYYRLLGESICLDCAEEGMRYGD